MAKATTESSAEILKRVWRDDGEKAMRQVSKDFNSMLYGPRCRSPILPGTIWGAWRQAREPASTWYFMPITGFLHMSELIWASPYDDEAQGVLGDWLLEQGWILDATRESICGWATGIVSRLVFRHWWPKNQDWFLRSEGWFPWLNPPHTLFNLNREADPLRLAGQQLIIYDEDIAS